MPKSVFTDAHAAVVAALADLRRQRGLSQVELARRLGKHQQFVSYYERGDRRIDLVEFCVIVQALEGDPAKILAELVQRFPAELSI